jgi:outer membrane PBP1 activator LpoA protein
MTRKPIIAALLLTCFSLTACSISTVTAPVDTSVLEQRAAAAESNGSPRTAADIYVQLANSVSGSRRIGFLLEASRLYIAAGAYANAAQLLATLDGSATPDQRALAETLSARIDLAENRPADAAMRVESLLNSPDNSIRLVALEIQGLAFFALDRPEDAIRSLSEREVWLNDLASIRDNQRTIWSALQRARIPVDTTPTGEPIVDGWLALAPIAIIPAEDERRRELLQWRTAYRQHPAAGILLRELLLDESAGDAPRQIALLLPLTTAARDNALAIRDGFMAAYIAAGVGKATSVRVYDTGQEGAAAAYLRAQVEGADFVVGPLLRQEVENVVAEAGLVPTLALNYTLTEPTGFGSIYQFALAPEDEAAATARRAIA